jgi:small neutral amino acid transporter SnatA (MarC family)
MSIIGIPIGFYGYLFPGNINLMVVELYDTKKYKLLSIILLLIVFFESFYCGLSLTFLNVIKSHSGFYKSVEVVSYVLIFTMGVWMLVEKRNDKNSTHQNTIIRGVFSVVIHPQQIPFWVVAGVLVNKFIQFNINNPASFYFIFYNAIGTLLAMFTYMIFGKKLLNYFKLNIAHINKAMGAAYILLVLYHFVSISIFP